MNQNFDEPPPPHDELDAQLRRWHEANRAQALSGRARLMNAIAQHSSRAPYRPIAGRIGLRQRLTAAAVLMLFVIGGMVLLSLPPSQAGACDTVMVPDGGRLDAFTPRGDLLGPCPLAHTDVVADVSGPFSRVAVTQTYTNTYTQKVEAVYTFPLSHRAAVDRMTMTVRTPEGDRVVQGEVKERTLARQMYEAARESGYVASLLEQERPNIFTQSVANIEPGATVIVEIGYVETLQSRDGVFSFDFPTVVGPRYIPGNAASPGSLPTGLSGRPGICLLGPAAIEVGADAPSTAPTAAQLSSWLAGAVAIAPPGTEWMQRPGATPEEVRSAFTAAYANGSKETGALYADGTGQINGRWFFIPTAVANDPGTGFAPGTNQVPDAARITPMPVPPPTRAGHDISIEVRINTGGAAILGVDSELHHIIEEPGYAAGSPARRAVKLASGSEIPNRDFVLNWRVAGDAIAEGFFTHATPFFMSGPAMMVKREDWGSTDDASTWVDTDGYFTLVLSPPARMEAKDVRAREVIFVLDTSGSMSGFPIEKAKEVMSKAIGALRAQDTFNLITFSGDTHILWEQCRTGTPENIAAAQAIVDGQRGGGGTEMMAAINAALVQTAAGGAAQLDPLALANLPADGREVELVAAMTAVTQDGNGQTAVSVSPQLSIPLGLSVALPTVLQPEGVQLILKGQWLTRDGQRLLQVREASFAHDRPGAPMRICVFMTDGYVGNDEAIIQAVADNARTTRVFSFGIGNSVNRYLLDGMARAGRGAVDYVLLSSDAEAAVNTLTKRIQTPVLTDVSVAFEGLEVRDCVPAMNALPDLFDVTPLIINGRYNRSGAGTIVVRGTTAAGPWEKRIAVETPPLADGNPVAPTLWARSRVDQLLDGHLDEAQTNSLSAELRRQIIALGERYSIMTPLTSFVAVEKARVTVGGRAVLVAVPIELPQGTRWEGFFGPLHAPVRPITDSRHGALHAWAENARQNAPVWFDIDADGLSERVEVESLALLGDIPAVADSLERYRSAVAGDPTAGKPTSSSLSARGDRLGAIALGERSESFGFKHAQGGVGELGSQGRTSLVSDNGRMAGGMAAPARPGLPSSGGTFAGVAVVVQSGGVGGGGGGSGGLVGGSVVDGTTTGTSLHFLAPSVTPAAPAEAGPGASKAAARRGAVDPAAVSAPPPPPAPVAIDPAQWSTYDIRDLVGFGVDAQADVERQAVELVVRMQEASDKARWIDQGGADAAWTAHDGVLLVLAPKVIHKQIAAFLRAEREAATRSAAGDPQLVEHALKVRGATPSSDRVFEPAELDALWDRLDDGLLMLALCGRVPAEQLDESPLGILVAIRLSDTSTHTLDALALRGFARDAVSEPTRVAVGRLRREFLDDAALSDGVERIAPLAPGSMKPAVE